MGWASQTTVCAGGTNTNLSQGGDGGRGQVRITYS
jgi:hypothetical protein